MLDSVDSKAIQRLSRDARESWIRTFAPDYLTDLLRRHAGNVSRAAKAAGLDRKTLHSLLAKYGVKT